LNIVDWSSFNMLGLGLECSVYLWNAGTSKVSIKNEYKYDESNGILTHTHLLTLHL